MVHCADGAAGMSGELPVGLSIGSGGRNSNGDLGADLAAEDIEAGANFFGALAHSSQSEMPGTSSLIKDSRVDATAIVNETESQLFWTVRQLDAKLCASA